MSVELPLWLWPLTLVLAAFGAWSVYRLVSLGRLATWPTISAIVGSAFAFIAFPVYTAVFWADPTIATPDTQTIPINMLGVLMFGYFAFVALTIYLAKGYRLPLAGMAAFLVWMNCGVLIVAAMAVSGVWL
jgi:hypothetical protein